MREKRQISKQESFSATLSRSLGFEQIQIKKKEEEVTVGMKREICKLMSGVLPIMHFTKTFAENLHSNLSNILLKLQFNLRLKVS